MQVRRPTDDVERVQTLHDLNILDQQPDPQFQDITKLVATIFRVSHFMLGSLATVLWLLMTYTAALPKSCWGRQGPAPSPCLSSAIHNVAVMFLTPSL